MDMRFGEVFPAVPYQTDARNDTIIVFAASTVPITIITSKPSRRVDPFLHPILGN